MTTEFYLNVDSLDRTSGTISNFYYQYTSRNINYNEKYLVILSTSIDDKINFSFVFFTILLFYGLDLD